MGLFMPAFFCPMFWYWDLPMLLQVGIFACFSLYYEYITLYLFTQLLIDVWIVSSSWLSSIMMPWMFFSGVLENMFALLLFDIYMDCVVARIPWWYPVTPVFAPVSSHWVQMEPVDMKRYHFPDDVNLYSKKDFADVIKATDQLTLRLGDCSGWDRPNQGNTYKGPAPPQKKKRVWGMREHVLGATWWGTKSSLEDMSAVPGWLPVRERGLSLPAVWNGVRLTTGMCLEGGSSQKPPERGTANQLPSYPVRPRVGKPVTLGIDFWPAHLWANKWVLF